MQTSQYLSHELLSGEHQLVVDDPAGQLFEQGAVGVDKDRLLVLHCLVAALAESRGVIEITCCYSLEETSIKGGMSVKSNVHGNEKSEMKSASVHLSIITTYTLYL